MTDRDRLLFDYEGGSGCVYDYVAPAVSMRSLSVLVNAASSYRTLNRWLDMGFGRGELLRIAAREHWEVYGTELAEPSLKIARGAGWHVAPSADAMTSASFDVVTMNGFIEHLANPDDALREAKRLLRPNGLLWISTPNSRGLNGRLLGLDWAAIEPPQHTIIWSPSGIKSALRRNGFAVRKIECTGLSPYSLMLRLRGQRRRGNEQDLIDARLNTLATQSRLLKSVINGSLSRLRLGDTLKAWADSTEA